MELPDQCPASVKKSPEPLKELSSSQWDEFLETCQTNNLTDSPDTLAPEFLSQLFKTWAGSDFAFEQCLKHPDLVFQFSENQNSLLTPKPNRHQNALHQLIQVALNENDLMHRLRVYRNREMVRIIWRDLNRLCTMQETTLDLSAMADACVDQSLSWLYDEACKTFGTPMGSVYGETPQPQKMIVLGMGKLGAHELNLSSDIDLMFTYPCKGETTGGSRTLDNQEFFIRLGQRLIKVLDSQTVDGFVFRVDMRLRPYGTSGALAMSFSAMEQYYQDQGRDWERYAMIKARAIAGDVTEGQNLLKILRPFTYRRYIDFSAISALRDMKTLIQREVKRKGMQSNIKLGPGGIREIEFIVQSFQLIHGGRDRSLQEKALLTVLGRLTPHYLPKDVTDELHEAYVYLRNVEHAIQALQDRQTQDLPVDELQQNRVAYSMGYDDWSLMMTDLDHYRQRVMYHFEQVISAPEEPKDQEHKIQEHWKLFWQGSLTEEEELKQFQENGFQKAEESRRRLLTLRDGKAITRIRRQSRERLDNFIPLLLEHIGHSEKPDLALTRILPLVEGVLRRTAYLVLLMENPGALEHLTKLCTASPWIADQIARHPALLDEFLDIGDLYNPPEKTELEHDLRQQLTHIPEDDLEAQMEALRYFKMSHLLKVAAAQVAGTLPLMKESDYLTWIAEVLLDQVVGLAWKTMIERHGHPVSEDGSLCDPGFTVIGYGKLGGIELSPGSDLDLVFVHNGASNKETDGPRPIESSTFYTRLGQRIIHILTTHTPSGRLYEVDMRLRPSGASGMLVSSLASFEKYQLNEAWTWEHQALVRARAVAGDKQLTAQFEELRKNILAIKRDPVKLKEDVVNMRLKMQAHLTQTKQDDQGNPLFHLKHDRGGIVDIEFLMQYAVLAHAHDHIEVARYPDNIRISESLEKMGYLTDEQGNNLREAYKLLRKAAHSKALQNEQSFVERPLVEPFIQHVEVLWQQWME
ncbi:bifunctional [glutamate--ammonia ligase]-adenylyl-L-tyrosine phosphorylase/[glutamate--ammonia-ligase] adenylyltransferase [Endozoicomonas arenosclerae]|uniref:bifunctional [glutamate--ammonia ligase]-adenylyl-L-tyrosine phosphorylase/[glutamate--ammonia-ligase] adenylyltransferase n=1 Tax=Endozoicomonas arenosclerae TaxID=1633495 RepID=UPI000783525B|nr:bifunctional [glutamate--ammonia ligase]-adenylyl-L-tyrosine phosphorylase/[glutamate--ammonia-ligase] adenylyltransferase [Endozoicomonas arenosclerae]